MPIEATKRFTDQRLRKVPNDWTASESWHVTGTLSKSEAIDAAVAHNEAHADNPRLKVFERDAESVGFGIWVVRANYKLGEHGEDSDDPLLNPYEIEWDFAEETVAIERDIDGNPIINSAGSPFDPPPTDTQIMPTLVVYRNEPFFSASTALTYMNRVNSNAFTIAGAGGVNAGQALCRLIKPTSRYGPLSQFVEVMYRFEFLQETTAGGSGTQPWQLHIRDQGPAGWWDDSGTKIPGPFYMEGSDGTPEPAMIDVLLDGTGRPINTQFKVGKGLAAAVTPPAAYAGLTLAAESTVDAKYLLWRRKRTADFSGFGF